MAKTGATDPIVTYARALTLGVATGLRSMTGLAALALAARPQGPYRELAQAPIPWRWLATRPALVGFCLAALGEYVGDKLSLTPARTTPGPLAGRIIFGAIAGAVACRAGGCSAVLGGALGALGALGGSFAGYTYRTEAVKRTGAPDLPLAIAEDATTIVLALAATRRAKGGD
jgi:uncharacterized membrane protein